MTLQRKRRILAIWYQARAATYGRASRYYRDFLMGRWRWAFSRSWLREEVATYSTLAEASSLTARVLMGIEDE